jgi:hypothetical protein
MAEMSENSPRFFDEASKAEETVLHIDYAADQLSRAHLHVTMCHRS